MFMSWLQGHKTSTRSASSTFKQLHGETQRAIPLIIHDLLQTDFNNGMTCDTVDMSFLARAWRCWRTLWKGKIRRRVNVGADCGFSNSRPLSFPQQCMAFIMDNNVLFCVCVGGARPISSMDELACHAVKIPAAPCLDDPQNYPSFYSTFVFFFICFTTLTYSGLTYAYCSNKQNNKYS